MMCGLTFGFRWLFLSLPPALAMSSAYIPDYNGRNKKLLRQRKEETWTWENIFSHGACVVTRPPLNEGA